MMEKSVFFFGRQIIGVLPLLSLLLRTSLGDVNINSMGSPIGYRIIGVETGGKSGYSVSGAGDVNKDGVGDVIIGAFDSASAIGISYVIFGRPKVQGISAYDDIQLSGATLVASVGFRILGANSNDLSGLSVSAAGDVNKDGIADIIVGAPGADPYTLAASSNAGMAYVIFGRNIAGGATPFGDIQLTTTSTAMNANFGFRILGAAANDELGHCVNKAGDVNGDSISDIIVSAKNALSGLGITYVIYGRNIAGGAPSFGDIVLTTTALSTIVGFRILGAIQSTGYSGFSVSGAGDVNQDGIDDVIIGSFSAYGGVTNRGISYVVFGRNIAGGAVAFGDVQLPSDTMDASVGFRIIGPISSDRVGNSVSGAGDVNGDGIADLLLGMDNVATSGKAYVVFGRNTAAGAPLFGDVFLPSATMSASVGFRILGLATGDLVGYSVSGAGDVNGDGWADILIGAVGTGDAYIIYGRNYPGGAAPFGDITVTTGASVMPTDVGFRIIGTSTSQVGISVKAAGDINGDGVADVIVGAPYADPPAGTDVGISYIFCGQAIIKPTSQPSGQPSGQPSRQPSRQPSSQPSRQPSSQPTRQPTAQPSRKPSTQPSMQPSRQPSSQPSSQPSRQPSTKPSSQPSCQPSRQPSQQPSAQPSKSPTAQPSGSPTMQPSRQPSAQPSRQPSGQPSRQPSVRPSSLPSCQPSCQPSMQPTTSPSMQPSGAPSAQPSKQPSMQPSDQPSVSPSRQPSSQPSGLPTIQSMTRPSSQPSMQPSSQLTSQPTLQPTMQPSIQPTCQPIAQPTLQPITSPSAQPTSMPSIQLTDRPTLQPSVQPSHVPSVQPTSTPSGLPSSQPSSQPSARPTAQPSEQPTAYPTAQPSVQPSIQPSGQPSTTPSAQPTMQPSSQPVSDPSSQPSSTPTVVPTQLLTAREYVYLIHTNSTSSRYSMARIGDVHWMCGKEQSVSSCAAVASPGMLQSQFEFNWDDIASIAQTDDPSVVMVSGRTLSADTMITHIARCVMGTELQCAVRSYSAANYVAVSFSPSVHKLVYTGSSGGYASVLISDTVTSAASTYQYASETMQSIAMTLVQSPPNFLGSFIVGTCTSVGSVTSIFAGMVRTDSGTMTAMYVMPVSGAITNSAELVNTMALEHTQPDSFIGGGLQTTGEASVSAYVLRVNALYQSVLNGWRYRINPSAVGGRRKLTVETVSNSVVKGLTIVEAELYVLVSWNTSISDSLNCISILRTELASGAVLQQVHIISNGSSLSCTQMNSAGMFLTIACSMLTPATGASRALLVSVDRQLTFSKLPIGFERYDHVVFSAESVAFQRTKLVLSAEKVTLATTDYAFNTANESPTLRPTVMTTRSPTVPPSVIPSAQPSSSPTATPSVSPQPTSQPSSSGPTNTYKPTVNPAQRPSMVPSNTPTVVPTQQPTVVPTVRPTVQPSRHPSVNPTVTPTTVPSRTPQNKPTMKPTTLPSIAPSCQPSGTSTTVTPSVMTATPVRSEGSDGNDNIALVIGGFIAGGLVFLWCGHKLLKWSVQSFDNYKQKRGMQSILDTNQLQRAKEASLQRHKARASGSSTSRLSVTAVKTTARASTTAAAVSLLTSSGGDPNNIIGKSPVCRDQDDEIASDSSVMLSSLHSSELSYIDEDGNSAYSSDETPVQSELLANSRPLSHVRSRESLMEEGSVVKSVIDSECGSSGGVEG